MKTVKANPAKHITLNAEQLQAAADRWERRMVKAFYLGIFSLPAGLAVSVSGIAIREPIVFIAGPLLLLAANANMILPLYKRNKFTKAAQAAQAATRKYIASPGRVDTKKYGAVIKFAGDNPGF